MSSTSASLNLVMICSGVQLRLLAIVNLRFSQILSLYLDQFSGVRSLLFVGVRGLEPPTSPKGE